MDQPTPNSTLQPQRAVSDLRELRALTSDEDGAQRVAWTDTWWTARQWFREKLATLPVEVTLDAAGNLWATLPGASDRELWIGGHLDSVPNGGWLDGCLNVVAGLEVLRRLADQGQAPLSVCLVDWADEEGRFGVSLLGSSAVSGHLNPPALRSMTDRSGVLLPDALAVYGVDLDRTFLAHQRLEKAAAYLELHIEQGPVLESLGLPLAAVLGACGVERHAIRFTGQAAHSGSTPMEMRRDALGAAAKFALEVREIARRQGGVGTVGRMVTQPGIPTSVVGQCDLTLDQRHLDAAALERMLLEARRASERFAREEHVDVEWQTIYHMEPVHFHPELVGLGAAAITELGYPGHRMPSGPLHDAVEMSRAGVPTGMLFVQSLRGLSHTKEEDTLPAHLELAVQALDGLVEKTMEWVLKKDEGEGD